MKAISINQFLALGKRTTSVVQIGLLAVAMLAVAPLAKAQYTGSILYEITTPSGFAVVNKIKAAGGQVAATAFLTPAQSSADAAAFVWMPNGSPVSLQPSGFTHSSCIFTNGTQQTGYGAGTATGGDTHALWWSGTAASAVDLNPSGSNHSECFATDGAQQVGFGYGTVEQIHHALLWSGTAASAVDLNPSGLSFSEAHATKEGQQVGYGGGPLINNKTHALLWTGSAASAVDLNPSGFLNSEAVGTSGTQQVGIGWFATGPGHALLWTGTAAGVVDLSPSFAPYGCIAEGTNGTQQVGYGSDSSLINTFAILWWGTAASAVNLQSLLPPTGTWTFSAARSIESDGNVFGIASATIDNVTHSYAVEWSPVPEPASATLLMLGAVIIFVYLNCRRSTASAPVA